MVSKSSVLFCLMVLVAITTPGSPGQQGGTKTALSRRTIEGPVSDTHCKCKPEALERHRQKPSCPDDCVRKGREQNEKKRKEGKPPGKDVLYGVCEMAVGFYVVAPQDQSKVAAYAGRRVRLSGTFEGDTVTVASITPLELDHQEWYAAAKEHYWTGWVTDTKCGAKGADAAHADCLKKCIAGGEEYALYVPATKKLYKLGPQDKVAEHGAHHVRVTGTVEGDTIHVASISMVAEKKAAKAKPAAKTTKQ